MKTTEEYLRLLRQSKHSLQQRYPVTRLAIFGSVARGEQTEHSDIDICFEGAAMGLFSLCRMKAELERLLGCRVDLLRMRGQLEETAFGETLKDELIYV